jgi:hypothetical protein
MFEAFYPRFERGRVLKIEMLESLRDFPRDILTLTYQKNAKGILTGCELSVEEAQLIIHPGVLYKTGVFYILKNPYRVDYHNNGRLTALKVKCITNQQEKDFIRHHSEIYLDDQMECSEDEIELCRFKLKEGSRLRNEYVDFRDLNTEYDTINRIYAPYVAGEETTLWPQIVKTFAKEALKARPQDPIDVQFALMSLQASQPIKKEVLLHYLEWKEQGIQPLSSLALTNHKIYEALVQILHEIESKGSSHRRKNGFAKGILID